MTLMTEHPTLHEPVADSPSQYIRAEDVVFFNSFPAKASTFHLPQRRHRRNAFSLIEVVLAIGVVAFALLGIVGLFSSSMKNNRDSSAQQESFQAARMISSRMQDTNFFLPNSLGTIHTNLCNSPRVTNYFLYTSNDAIILTNSANSYGVSNGTLYCVQMLLSQNLLSMTNAFPIAGGGTNPSGSDWTNWPGLPLSIRVYSLPNPRLTNTLTNTVPVMTFDMVIPR